MLDGMTDPTTQGCEIGGWAHEWQGVSLSSPPHPAQHSPWGDCHGAEKTTGLPGWLKLEFLKFDFQESMRLKPNDGNAATHLIRSALGEATVFELRYIWWSMFHTTFLCFVLFLSGFILVYSNWDWIKWLIIRHTGGTAYGVDHGRLSQMLTIPQVSRLVLFFQLLTRLPSSGYGAHVQGRHHYYRHILWGWISPVLLTLLLQFCSQTRFNDGV